jgi:hypothetical protein
MYEGMGVAATLALAGDTPAQRELGSLQSATGDYFRAMGIPLIAGRLFVQEDTAAGPPVVILSEGAARVMAPGSAALIGRRLSSLLDGTEPEIVGIVGDAWIRHMPPNSDTPNETVYRPIAQHAPVGPIGVVVGVTGDRQTVIRSVRAALRELDPDLPTYNVVPVDELRPRFLATERLTLAVTAGLSLVSLAVAAVGLYGLLAQVVSQRTREIGIRMALGADRARVRSAIVFSALRLTMAGEAIGIVVVALGWRTMAAWIPQLDAPGVGALSVNCAVLVGVAMLASWVPARRASAIDPVAVLKSE